jgi:hypothetical protein
MNIKIFRRCSLFPAWSDQGIISILYNPNFNINTGIYKFVVLRYVERLNAYE